MSIEAVLSIIELIVLVLGFLGLGLIPKLFYERKLKDYNAEINRALKEFKHELNLELQELRISQENSQPKKVEGFIEFSDMIYKTIELSRLSPGKKFNEKEKEIANDLRKFSYVVFFFGKDETILKFVEFRKEMELLNHLNQNQKRSDHAYYQSRLMIIILAELMINMRKDLGNNSSEVTIDDYMTILVNDWDKSKLQFMQDVEKAKELKKE